MSTSSDFRSLRHQASGMGWTPSKTNGGHIRWRHACGSIVFAPSTPGDRRSLKNTLAQLKRMAKRMRK
ncbi:hypothetical protein HKD24_09165 [Gluconobacter sp. LMG 31484]|uniref:Type II toxin-antitoxin system HicA family toxin n=1 Tax=Gluconobacter vitians TaxID=2728102 RepID=A0ABR9Y617_9PROT|nr:hypothetical protein [Gluconobacter vitians]MBF0859382.1 hypothetical protein [Gluconobacter vitians]